MVITVVGVAIVNGLPVAADERAEDRREVARA